jgi:hypothetical protein
MIAKSMFRRKLLVRLISPRATALRFELMLSET